MWTASCSGGPEVLPRIAQPCLCRGSRSGRDEALRHRLHFASKWVKILRSAPPDEGPLSKSHPYPTQPLRNPRQRTHQEPPHHRERDGDNQYHRGYDPPEASPPEVVTLIPYVSSVHQDDKCADKAIPVMQRKHFLEPLDILRMPECIDASLFLAIAQPGSETATRQVSSWPEIQRADAPGLEKQRALLRKK